MLYECLTGEPPFAADTMPRLIVAHMSWPPPRVSVTHPNVPAAVDNVIATGMAKDPDHRYATTLELADAARDAITVPIQQPTPSPAPQQHTPEPYDTRPKPPPSPWAPAAAQLVPESPIYYDPQFVSPAPQDQRTPSHLPLRAAAATPTRVGRVSRRTTIALMTGVIALIVVILAALGISGYLRRESSTTAQPSSAAAPSLSIEQVVTKVVPTVVDLRVDVGSQSQEGSGIILSADGLVLTDDHIIATLTNSPGPGSNGAPKTTVTFSDGRTAPFTVVGTDPTSDVAVVRVQGVSGLSPINVGSSSDLQVGQSVIAIGSPLGSGEKTTTGTIIALNRPVSTTTESANQNTVFEAIQTNAAINASYSGGPLVNMQGQLVGLDAATATLSADSGDPQGGGFAIPVDQAKRIAAELISAGKATHASLGVQVMDSKGTPGAQIVEVVQGGAAANAGVPKGVVVTKFDDSPINSADALRAANHSKAPGDKITLTYIDPSGAQKTAQVTLGTAEP